MKRIGVVGSGPAAFYTVQKLFKWNKNISVDMFEKLPVPFGLVRYGVAPDHPEVKNVINTFNQVCNNESFRFFGNVNVGVDITIKEMRNMFDAVLLAYGSVSDKKLNIPGEEFKDVYSSTDIVGWYNGLPEKEQFEPNLNCEEAVIIGHGNVALDIARILLTPIELLKKTDIPDRVLNQLNTSRIKKVTLVGRRGPLQVAFTIKEFRELLRIPRTSSEIILPSEIKNSLKLNIIDEMPRPRRRLTQLILDASQSTDADKNNKNWKLLFVRNPKRIVLDDTNQNILGVEFEINCLKNQRDVLCNEFVGTGQEELLPCQIVVRSVGYQNVQIDLSVPFDFKTNTIPNDKGRVIETVNLSSETEINCPLYCVGWIKRGPKGVILSTISDANETATSMFEDLDLPERKKYTKVNVDVADILEKRAIRVVTLDGWNNIDNLEMIRGEQRGKPREKLTSISELLAAAVSKRLKN